jgi:hypothetical protein
LTRRTSPAILISVKGTKGTNGRRTMKTFDAVPSMADVVSGMVAEPRAWSREWADAQTPYCDRVSWLKRSCAWPRVVAALGLTDDEIARLQPPKGYKFSEPLSDGHTVGCPVEFTLARDDGSIVVVAVNEDGTRAAVS